MMGLFIGYYGHSLGADMACAGIVPRLRRLVTSQQPALVQTINCLNSSTGNSSERREISAEALAASATGAAIGHPPTVLQLACLFRRCLTARLLSISTALPHRQTVGHSSDNSLSEQPDWKLVQAQGDQR